MASPASVTIGLALGLVAVSGSTALAQSPAQDELVLTVAPLRGKGGASCAASLSKLISTEMQVEPWSRGSSVEGFHDFEALSRFVEKQGRALGAQIVVVGTLRTTKLILEAYEVNGGALLNLDRVPISKSAARCTVGRRGRAQVLRFADRAQSAYLRRAKSAAARAVAAQAALAADTQKATSTEVGPAKTSTATVAASIPTPDAAPREAAPAKPQPAATEAPQDEAPVTESAFSGSDDVLRASSDKPKKGQSAPPVLSSPPKKGPPPVLEVEPQVGISQRRLAFENSEGGTLRTHQIGAMFTPGLRVRATPFARDARAWLRPLSLELVFRQSPTFQSRRVKDGPEVDTRYAEVAGLVRYAIPIPGSRFVVAPELGAHSLQYSLRGIATGAAGQDTPSVGYRSLLLGVGLEAELVPNADVRLSGAYLPVLTAGRVFSAQYYPEGSAWALRIEAALTVRVLPWLVVVVTGQYTGYSLNLKTQDATEDSATRASDRTTGLRFGVRADF